MLSHCHVQLFADCSPWTVARQAPLSMGIFQARVLEWGAIAFSSFIWLLMQLTHAAFWKENMEKYIFCYFKKHF